MGSSRLPRRISIHVTPARGHFHSRPLTLAYLIQNQPRCSHPETNFPSFLCHSRREFPLFPLSSRKRFPPFPLSFPQGICVFCCGCICGCSCCCCCCCCCCCPCGCYCSRSSNCSRNSRSTHDCFPCPTIREAGFSPTPLQPTPTPILPSSPVLLSLPSSDLSEGAREP